ncbi:stage II sporulation protein AB (anti-sigma F factor) [Amphibacillus marinus]|uniref:Anti-sigma F factor n=1 Tax=Amphibacillus marinus TaxID=872970 RepID=A0A1H8GCN3_9BACI|nr:anti-sigma F factor [Amphibacillus marinus]SEN41068.1 stage II sporulation protein AB (anti-sigma F factor) [Amphibacillus marinus]
MTNHMNVSFKSKSVNESFARVVIAAFLAPLDPTLDELTEIKTVVSEAVTNAIIHGYEQSEDFDVYLTAEIIENKVKITIEDLGIGIENVNKAIQPLYTSKPELERSGMGFTIMENFMDKVVVESSLGQGTKVILEKTFQTTRSFCH